MPVRTTKQVQAGNSVEQGIDSKRKMRPHRQPQRDHGNTGPKPDQRFAPSAEQRNQAKQ
jgi:hypothetical protein